MYFQYQKRLCNQRIQSNQNDYNKKEYSDEAHTLIKEREAARQRKDWAKADEIRDRLDALGICVHDRKA